MTRRSRKLRPTDCLSRRHLLQQGAFSLTPVALAWLLQRETAQAEPVKPALQPEVHTLVAKPPANPPSATAMISLFMQGGPSQFETFDPKPGTDNGGPTEAIETAIEVIGRNADVHHPYAIYEKLKELRELYPQA